MRRLAVLLLLAIFSAAPAFSQSGPDVEALLDAIFAKDVSGLTAHLPQKLTDRLSRVSAEEREQFARDFLLAERMRGEGVIVTRGELPVLVVMEAPNNSPDAGHRMELILNKRISDGHDSVLLVSVRNWQGTADKGRKDMEVWMRLEESSWKIANILVAPGETLVEFEDGKLVVELRQRLLAANEASAVDNIRAYYKACLRYAVIYSGQGYPSSLDVLGEGPGAATVERSRLLEAAMTSPPYSKSGYRFEYRPSDLSPIGMYTIIACPVEYGRSGKRSYFSDETGDIHFTTADREPTANDPLLK